MTHRVRCHTSTGCLIAALRTVSAWVKWAERLSTVRWAEATALLLIWLGGWILRRCGRSGSSWVSTPAQFYSWGASAAIHAGGHRNAPNTSSFEWHLKPQNVAECGHWSKCFSFFFFPPLIFGPVSFVVIAAAFFFSHHSNMTWQRNSIVMSHCDRFIDEKWDESKWRVPRPKEYRDKGLLKKDKSWFVSHGCAHLARMLIHVFGQDFSHLNV